MQKIKFDFEATKERIYAPNSNVPIGAPVDRNGNIANDGNAYGIVLCKETENEKYWVKYNLVVMVAGYCDIIDAQAIWGDEYSAEAIAAMSDIVFCDNHKIGGGGGGGGWPADLPKPSVGGYGYTEQGEQTVIVDNESITTVDTEGVAVGQFATPFDIVDGAYTVIFNGTEYNLNSVFFKERGFWYLGDISERAPDFSRYPFMIASRGEEARLYTESAGDYEITVKTTLDTIHKIDGKYLPQSGGTMMVNITANSGGYVADKTYGEIMYAIETGVVVKCVIYDENARRNFVCDLHSYDI